LKPSEPSSIGSQADDSPPAARQHARRPALAMQFDDLRQQHDTAEMGMWIFLVTEVMFFGGLFLEYSIYRVQDEQGFIIASRHMELALGTVNTAVLLTSSLCMALAVQSAQSGRRRQLLNWLSLTILLGSIFLGIKSYEYYVKYTEHLVPLRGWPFDFEPEHYGTAKIFYSLYFAMTGLHALHMLIGIGVLLTLLTLATRGGLLGERASPVHVVGLYWHFVDIVWVFLFPLLYLIGAH
jgi:cytochrome c oxidase subunit III